jgi:drug/metabolite transporter (DMT)-like permease
LGHNHAFNQNHRERGIPAFRPYFLAVRHGGRADGQRFAPAQAAEPTKRAANPFCMLNSFDWHALAEFCQLSFPIALSLGNDRFSARKLIGLTLGFGAVVLIAANSGSFEGDVTLWWIAVALVAPSFYALEGNVVAKWGTYGFDAIETLFWSSVFGLVPSLLLALGTGQFIPVPTTWGTPEFAFLIIAVAHAVVYAGYVWLVSNAGPVFAAQVSYLVTIFGIFWAIVLLHEAYANGIWLALALMLSGMFLVQPRARKSEEDALA